jgi:hypothetical protein
MHPTAAHDQPVAYQTDEDSRRAESCACDLGKIAPLCEIARMPTSAHKATDHARTAHTIRNQRKSDKHGHK